MSKKDFPKLGAATPSRIHGGQRARGKGARASVSGKRSFAIPRNPPTASARRGRRGAAMREDSHSSEDRIFDASPRLRRRGRTVLATWHPRSDRKIRKKENRASHLFPLTPSLPPSEAPPPPLPLPPFPRSTWSVVCVALSARVPNGKTSRGLSRQKGHCLRLALTNVSLVAREERQGRQQGSTPSSC